MTTEAVRRPPAKRRKGHAALAARVLTAGLATSSAVGLIGVLANAERPPASATTAPPNPTVPADGRVDRLIAAPAAAGGTNPATAPPAPPPQPTAPTPTVATSPAPAPSAAAAPVVTAPPVAAPPVTAPPVTAPAVTAPPVTVPPVTAPPAATTSAS